MGLLISGSSFASDRSQVNKLFIFGKDVLGESFFDYDKANKFRPPKQLQFTVDETCEVDTNQINIKAYLINNFPRVLEIIVFPVSDHYPFSAHITMTKEVIWSDKAIPKSAPVPPPPMTIKIPAHSKVEFKYGIDISDLLYKGTPKVEIKWVFNYWREPKPTGVISVVLPAR